MAIDENIKNDHLLLKKDSINTSIKKTFVNVTKSYVMLLVILGIIIVVSFLNPNFLTASNLQNVFKQVSVVGIIACGSAFVIISGMVDLSVGSIVSLSGVMYVMLYDSMGWFPAVLLCIAIGALFGFISGGIISAVKGNMGVSFIVTYGMMSVIAAIAILASGGTFKSGPANDPTFRIMGSDLAPILIFIVSIIICQFILVKTKAGRRIRFIGINEKASRLSGVRTKFYRLLVFVLSGAFASLAAVVMVSRVGSASPTSGTGYELDAIAAIVVGGVSLSGGFGSFVNVFLGVVILGILSNALNILGVSSNEQLIVRGALIVLAVFIDAIMKRRG